jgi:hypothetical protein
MEILNQYCVRQLARLKVDGTLSVFYALLAEALFLGYLGFIALFTVETLLPTFVTVRFSLTKFLFVLFLLSFVLGLLGRYLDLNFSWTIRKKSPWLMLGLFWTLGILALSLYKFPPLVILILILGFACTGFLFWKIFFDEEK